MLLLRDPVRLEPEWSVRPLGVCLSLLPRVSFTLRPHGHCLGAVGSASPNPVFDFLLLLLLSFGLLGRSRVAGSDSDPLASLRLRVKAQLSSYCPFASLQGSAPQTELA